MSRYPILVERLGKQQALRIVCEACQAEAMITPDDLNQDGVWPCPDLLCDGDAVFKYSEAEGCPNCRKPGFFPDGLTACSRACELQVEYAKSLAGRS